MKDRKVLATHVKDRKGIKKGKWGAFCCFIYSSSLAQGAAAGWQFKGGRVVTVLGAGDMGLSEFNNR